MNAQPGRYEWARTAQQAHRYPPNATPIRATQWETFRAVTNGARTVRDVGAALGVSSSSNAHYRLMEARKARLVTWEHGTAATIRPAMRVVDVEGIAPRAG